MAKTDKKFNIKNKELGVLRAFLKQSDLKVVVVGSYALYNIKNKDKIDNLQLVFNDVDVDLYKSLYYEISKSLEDNISRDSNINDIIKEKFNAILEELTSYSNIDSVDLHLHRGIITERLGNNATLGGKLIFTLNSKEFTEYVKVDINFENKNFEIENHEVEIENETYYANTYIYEKILADKYIAFNKHFRSAKIELSDSKNNIDNIDNMKKLGKDIYDITFIYNKVKSHDKVINYMNSMVKKGRRAESIRNMINIFIGKVIINYPNVVKTRDNGEDISNLILEFSN